MIKWCTYHQHKVHILLTKSDKLTNHHSKITLFDVQKNLKKYKDQVSVQIFSSTEKQGLIEIHSKIDEWLKS